VIFFFSNRIVGAEKKEHVLIPEVGLDTLAIITRPPNDLTKGFSLVGLSNDGKRIECPELGSQAKATEN
jgi:hypothetical protein